MKKILIFCLLLLFPLQVYGQQAPKAATAETIDWQVVANWKINAKPLDLVHSLDNLKVYILGDDNNVHVFSAQGEELGLVPVDKGVTAIDISPRGEMLYLINGTEQTFTSLALSFITQIDTTGSPFLGNPNAPVVLAVFSDFQ